MTTKATRDVLDLATRPILNIDLRGGAINGTTIGMTTPDQGKFTNLTCQNFFVTNMVDFGTATLSGTIRAKYGDIAEMYLADYDYEPGTLVSIGGEHEVTQTREDADMNVFGVVTTAPAFILNNQSNGDTKGEHWVAVALFGRAPVWVTGSVAKGDRLVASEIPGVARAMTDSDPLFSVVGRALEDKADDNTDLVLAFVSANK